MVIFTDLLLNENNMKTLIKNNASSKQPKINATVKVDVKLDQIKNIKFTSNKLEEINKVEFKLSFK
ncbi:hypothetical protein D0817_03315 [Flavobacterium cupreum]|uniref:Uncharacterized protein n=2 Tax=Flavobacterium cupreum TaxID=2133766 RepID=A0A434ABK3_9FLAO|nr:hypothetical protein D0817_03315 [Flavobacterium cupreum]